MILIIYKMNLEQIVKETVAKIIAEKALTTAEKKKKEDIVMAMKKDFKGPKSAMYAIATDKAKKLAEEDGTTPYEQGEAANDNNQDYNTNPYEAGTKEHDLWWNGWLNAETGKQIAHDDYMLNWERGFNETRDPNSESDTPYYAVFDFHSKQPHYIIAKSASEMLSRLNGYIRAKAETNPEYKFSYDIESLQDDYYNGKLMPHVISDDFASVTKNAEEFKQDLSYYPNAIEYKGLEKSQELDEFMIRRWQHYAGIK